MELKKTSQADLESERTTFFLLGFTVVLASLFVLLEWSSEDTVPVAWEELSPVVIENEFTYNEIPSETRVEPEIQPVTQVETTPKVVYEDYNIVEEVPEEEIIEPHAEEIPPEDLEEDPLPEQLPEEETLETVFAEVEIMPQFPNGYAAMNRYLYNHLKYPASASSQRIEGRVWSSFIVNKDGSLSDIRIEEGVYISLDQEALRVLRSMPPWIPGSVRGEPVRVKVYVPIVFKL